MIEGGALTRDQEGRSISARRIGRVMIESSGRLSGVYVTIFLIVLFTVLIPENFATSVNARIIISSEAVAVILALALVIALSADILDVSVAGTMGMAVVFVGWLQQQGVNPVWSVVLTLMMGLVVGAINALNIIVLKVPALIATLGMISVLTAIGYWLTDGIGVVSGLSDGFKRAGQAQPFSIPAPVFYMLGVAAIVHYVLEYMPFGRKIRAVGDNRDAARLAGLRVEWLTLKVLLASSGIAAFAGVVYAARLGTAPLDAGDPYLLTTFAAAFLGSTQIRPGRFNVIGTIVAVYLLAIGINGVQFLYPNSSVWLKGLFSGCALIVAVALSVRRRSTS